MNGTSCPHGDALPCGTHRYVVAVPLAAIPPCRQSRNSARSRLGLTTTANSVIRRKPARKRTFGESLEHEFITPRPTFIFHFHPPLCDLLSGVEAKQSRRAAYPAPAISFAARFALHWRAFDGTELTEHAVIPRIRPQRPFTANAFAKVQTCVARHNFLLLKTAIGARQYR